MTDISVSGVTGLIDALIEPRVETVLLVMLMRISNIDPSLVKRDAERRGGEHL